MNDKTALALRKLKDGDGNYLWNQANDTILGRQVIISEYMPLVWYLAVLGVNTPFKFAVFVREGAAPLPCIKGDRDSDRPWGQISQNKSENDKKEK